MDKTMQNNFLNKLSNFLTSTFEKIAISRTRQALTMLDDKTLEDIGLTRHQVMNGDLFNANDVVSFPAGSMGFNSKADQDNKKVETAKAA